MSVKGRQFTGKMQNNVSTLRDQFIFATLGKTGSGRVSLDTVGRKFAQVATSQVVESGSTDNILKLTGHAVKEGWLIRITTSANAIIEEEVLVDEIIDPSTIRLSGFLSAELVAGDTVDIYKPVFERVASDGSSLATVVSPPMQIIKNNVVQTVEDSTNPAEVVAIPVLIKAVDGTNITIQAGDINIQTSSEGVNFDSQRIGDGTGKWAGITADLELKTHDEGVIDAINNLSSGGLATEDKQDTLIAGVLDVETELQTLNAVDFATEAKQDLLQASMGAPADTTAATYFGTFSLIALIKRVGLLLTSIDTQMVGQSTAAKQDTAQARLDLLATETTVADIKTKTLTLATEAKQDAGIVQSTATNTVLGLQADAAATTDAGAFSLMAYIKRGMGNWTTLLARVPAIGQKAKVGSVPVVLASDSDNLKINESNSAGQMQKGALAVSGATTAIAPANATGCYIKNQLESAGTLYYEIGGTANSLSADLSGGQGTAFIPCTGTISLLAGADGACNYSVQWLIK